MRNFRHLSTLSSQSTYELNTHLKQLLQSNRLLDARNLFDKTPQRDQITWTTLIKAYLNSNNPLESLSLFSNLHSTSSFDRPDQFVLSLAIKASATSLSLLPVAQSVHSHCIKCGALPSSIFVATTLVDMYSRNDPSPSNALKVFNEMPLKNVVSWTAAINALVFADRCHDALRLFAEMRRANLHCDSHTYATIFKACTNKNLLSRGKEVHAQTIKAGLDSASFVANTLASMYSKCRDFTQAVMVSEA